MPRKKKNKPIEKPIPLIMIDGMKKLNPDVFDTIAASADVVDKKMKDIKFDSRCYIPSYFITKLRDEFYTNIDVEDTPILFHLASWRKFKQIYSFDADFVNILVESATDELIPCDALKNVPYPSFYVQIDGDSDIGYGIIGFFVAFDIVGDDVLLDLMGITRDSGMISVPIMLKDGMSIESSFKEIKRLCGNHVSRRKLDIMQDFAVKAIQLILYICAVNADIAENPKQKSYMRKPSNFKHEKDITREIQKWDVGVRIGQTIRMHDMNESAEHGESSGRSGSHSKKRPHMRRGHFHHYWKGSKIFNNQQLVLKWVAPTFINGNLGDLPAVITNVE